MHNKLKTKITTLIIFFLFFTSCSQSSNKQAEKFNLTVEEHLWLEKIFRYFMLHETAVYTLVGSKPLTGMVLTYDEITEETSREQNKEEYFYFLLNRSNEKDMEFYNSLSPLEKKEKAYLINDKNFIYNIADLWDKWEKIQDRFNIKKKFLLVKKERPKNEWKDLFPDYKAMYDIYFVDVFKTAFVIQENYELFKQAVGYDFDPFKIVLELENENSNFWDKITGKGAWQYSHLWGLLYGFGKENSFLHRWNNRHIRQIDCDDREKYVATSIKKWSSSKNRPTFSDNNAFNISNFTIPIFFSYTENDPIVIKYEIERKKIKKLYKGKDFVSFTLELLTKTSDK